MPAVTADKLGSNCRGQNCECNRNGRWTPLAYQGKLGITIGAKPEIYMLWL